MNAFQHIQNKIQNWHQAAQTVQDWKNHGHKVVFTNGCFDLLHYGHVHYLAAAKDLGNFLVVGVNAADSIRRLKGPNRPIQDDTTRLHLLAALEPVDLVVIFDQDTPLELINLLMPNLLVKGGDWPVHQIIGAAEVLAAGGKVQNLPFVQGYSTTAIESKIKSSNSC